MDAKPLEIIDGREEVIIFTRQPEAVKITSREVGEALANSASDDQADILLSWFNAINRFNIKRCESWPMQCRYIAECLTDRHATSIALMLEELTDHLRAIQVERSVAQVTDDIVGRVHDVIGGTPAPASSLAEIERAVGDQTPVGRRER